MQKMHHNPKLFVLVLVSVHIACSYGSGVDAGKMAGSFYRRVMSKFFDDSADIVTVPSSSSPITAPMVAPSGPRESWCVARSGVANSSLQVALDYACGIGGANCSDIQQGGSCYNPNNLPSHASYAFNSYYQRNPGQRSCDFRGTAMITDMNPSSGSCTFATGSMTISPTPASTGATTGGLGASPVYSNGSNTDEEGTPPDISQIPPNADTSSVSTSRASKPLFGGLIVAIFITSWMFQAKL